MAHDAISWSKLDEDAAFRKFWRQATAETAISTFEALLQVGLIEKFDVIGTDDFGRKRTFAFYKFFHDQYTQYCLAAVYKSRVLGRVEASDLARAGRLEEIERKVTDLIHRAMDAPVLAGALDHWLHASLQLPPKTGADLRLPLLNRLANSDSGAVRFWARSFLTGLIRKGILDPETLYGIVFRDGNDRLRFSLAAAFSEFWPDLRAEALAAVIQTCHEKKDERVLRQLANVFAFHFGNAPADVLAYIGQALTPIQNVVGLVSAFLNRDRMEREGTFLLTFLYVSVPASFYSGQHMALLREFAKTKYSLLIDALIGRRMRLPSLRGLTESGIRLWGYGKLEEVGLTYWSEVIASVGGNHTFFVEDQGIVQRDVVFEFFPYAVAVHNGEIEKVSLADGSPFRRLVLRMMNYRFCSAVGYFATVALSVTLSKNWDATEAFIDSLIGLNTDSSRYFGTLLLVNLSYMAPELSVSALELFNRKLVPWILSLSLEFEPGTYTDTIYAWAVLDCLGIADIDVEHGWPPCARALTQVLDYFARRGDAEAIRKMGDEIMKASFFPDIRIGTNMIELMLRRGCLTEPLWRPCVLKVLAGMLARSPGTLREILEAHSAPPGVLAEVRELLTDEVIDSRDRFLYQIGGNRAISWACASNVIARNLLIAILVGGIAQSNSGEDFAREVRRFVVELAAAYLGGTPDPARYEKLSVEEALAQTESRRVIRAGRVWRGKPE